MGVDLSCRAYFGRANNIIVVLHYNRGISRSRRVHMRACEDASLCPIASDAGSVAAKKLIM
jgi:hypothetical protein